jgi:hypothetical protein
MMKIQIRLVILFLSCLTIQSLTGEYCFGQYNTQATGSDGYASFNGHWVVPGVVLIGLKPDINVEGHLLKTINAGLNAITNDRRIQKMEQVFTGIHNLMQLREGNIDISLDKIFRLRFDPQIDIQVIIDEIGRAHV